MSIYLTQFRQNYFVFNATRLTAKQCQKRYDQICETLNLKQATLNKEQTNSFRFITTKINSLYIDKFEDWSFKGGGFQTYANIEKVHHLN